MNEAQDATRAREEVVAVVSHDLRTPLSAIATAVELLDGVIEREGLVDPSGLLHKGIGIIRRSSVRMTRLVDDLLDLASIDAGGLSIVRRPERPELLAREAFDVAIAQAEHKGVHLRLDVAGELPPLWCDRVRVLQALGNLLSNALKFTDPGGLIELRAETIGPDVVFSVRDTGVGIASDHLQHVFDRWWRARRVDREGHGLGLSIVKGIVEAHGGKIGAHSELGRGSRFWFAIAIAGGAGR
jgi:signal transduction histidine kinase